MCRKVSGAPFITAAAFAQTTFAWTKGEPAVYRSSAEAERGFCARCGSTLSFRLFASHDWIYVFVGSLDRPQDGFHHYWRHGRGVGLFRRHS